jgi:hypothetical protein
MQIMTSNYSNDVMTPLCVTMAALVCELSSSLTSLIIVILYSGVKKAQLKSDYLITNMKYRVVGTWEHGTRLGWG